MIKFAVVMDPLEKINAKKDSTVAMLRAAKAKGWQTYYLPPSRLSAHKENAHGEAWEIDVNDNSDDWYQVVNKQPCNLNDFDIIFMRKDPPFNMAYIHMTYILELAEKQGVVVANSPQGLRDANEKFFTTWFPQCIPHTIVSRNIHELRQFWLEHKKAVFKPLDGMGGKSIFIVDESEKNINVILETLTGDGQQFIMGQAYIPEINDTGDKRILLIDGEVVPYALARIPGKGDPRGNLAAGGTGKVVKLTERDEWLCQQIAPTLKAKGLTFVGIDVIGDYMTEINVTSPTCIQEIAKETGIDIAGQLMDCLEEKVKK